MHVIGLLGGVACGKSYVANLFKELGAEVIEADQLGHEALRLADVEQAARDRWGDDIFDAAGRIDRAALSQIVFAAGDDDQRAHAQAERQYLESLTHPRIGELFLKRLEQLRGRVPPLKALILDVPLLLKSGWNKFCDHVIFVDAPRDVRLARARGRGWSEEQFAAREAAQESLDEKRAAADLIIANATTEAATTEQVRKFWQSLAN